LKSPEYREGPEARKAFDNGMAKLFRAKKPTAAKEEPQSKRKPKNTSKG
jgi:hypothetical protein